MPILRPIFSIIFFTILAWFLSREIFQSILLLPARTDFGGYQILDKLYQFTGIQTLHEGSSIVLSSREVSGQFIMLLKQSLYMGLFFSIPILFWEVYRSMMPNIKLKDSLAYIFKTSLLFYIGAFLGYYIILPMAISFLGSFSIDQSIQNEFAIDDYVMLVFKMMFIMGFIFILPVILKFVIDIRRKPSIALSDISIMENRNEEIGEQPQKNPSMFTPILSILGVVRGVIYFVQDRPIAGILALVFGCVWGYLALRDRDLI
jgi:Sec-independent protein secretion pathway component TatC